MYDDLPGTRYRELPDSLNPEKSNQRPDMILVSREVNNSGKDVWIIELTSCMEENIEIWHTKKRNKYEGLARKLREDNYNVKNCPIEIGCRGYVPKNVNDLVKGLKFTENKIKIINQRLSRVALECSEKIFQYRNKTEWPMAEQVDGSRRIASI
jgi:hypothetical protein